MRKIALALAALMLTASLTACHGSRGLEPFVMPEAFDESKQYELTFWAKNDTNKAQTRVYEQAIADFEALYPNVKINLRLYTDYGRIYNDVITNITTQTTPNVCITYPDHIATYKTGANVVVPLDELMSDAEYGLGGSALKFDSPSVDEVIPEFLEEGKIGGVQYALPYMRSTEACYINKDFVESLGFEIPDELTWDFIWEVSDAATAKNSDGTFKVNGQKVMIPFIYKSTDNMMIQYLAQMGAGYSDADGNVLIFNDTTRDFLLEIANHVKLGAFSTFKISSYPANFLNAGQCVFAIDSTAGATWMGTDAPLSDIAEEKLVRFETVVKPIPQVDPSNPKMISQGPSVCVFNKSDPDEVLASWLFAQFLLTNEVQIGYSRTEGYVPVTTTAREDAEYVEYLASTLNDDAHYYVKLEASRILLENTANTFTTSVWNGSASLRDASGQMIENVTKSIRRSETVDDAYIDKLYSDVTSLYRLDKLGAQSGEAGKTELGPLPTTAALLLGALALAWLGIGAYVGLGALKNSKKIHKIR